MFFSDSCIFGGSYATISKAPHLSVRGKFVYLYAMRFQ